MLVQLVSIANTRLSKLAGFFSPQLMLPGVSALDLEDRISLKPLNCPFLRRLCHTGWQGSSAACCLVLSDAPSSVWGPCRAGGYTRAPTRAACARGFALSPWPLGLFLFHVFSCKIYFLTGFLLALGFKKKNLLLILTIMMPL